MLTEDDARRLLAQAAATIEVGPAAPVEPVRRRAWPVLAAAAATLVAGVGIWAGVAASDTDAAPDPALEQVEGTVPSVFGHGEAAATQILTDAGLDVRVVRRPACDPPGQAIGTLPSTGVRMEPGSIVTLQVAAPDPRGNCASELTVPWQLLGLATGEVAEPDLVTGALTAYLDGERRRVADAADPDAWGSPSALDALRAAVDWSPTVAREWRVLESGARGCDGAAFVPDAGPGTPSTRYAVEYDGPDAPCVQLTVVGGFGEAPRAVAVETAGLETATPDAPDDTAPGAAPTLPSVFGLTEGEAVARLRTAGIRSLVTVSEPSCYPPGRALSTDPRAGATVSPGGTVRLLVTTPQAGACLDDLGPAADAFWSLLDVARGTGPAPESASRVETWLDGQATTLSPADDAAWRGVPALAALRLVVEDARSAVAEGGGRLFALGAAEPFPPDCRVDGVTLDRPSTLDGRPATQAWFAYLRGEETRACLVVDLYVDARQQVDALVVRTVDPDGLLPEGASVPLGAEVDDLASQLVAFARGEWGVPVLADQVALYDDGDYQRTEPAEALANPDAWSVCDPATADDCVGSALEALRYADGEVPVAPADPRGLLAPGTASVVVLLPEVTSCQPRGAVTLFLDDTDAIVGVDVTALPSGTCGEEGLAPPE